MRVAVAKAIIVAKEAIHAADWLDLTARQMAAILGLSATKISRLRAGKYRLRPNGKEYELAVLFLHLCRSLDTIVGGDGPTARAWLRNPNTSLGMVPIERIQTIRGLTDTVGYLNARCAIA
ncbi:MAG: DUF2384 domain-containing protein [Azospirillum sp.]|nr:DUF2384 domain-containing protein [Azospirillum sp.]